MEALAQKVESLSTGGSTDLYGGWVTGAKVVGRGGRVILLSDGQANAGPFTDAASLSAHSAQSYEKYGVTTTTIGVGRDYDEGLMSGMARSGGGAHYFAHTASSITDAFSQERYSAGSVVLERLTVQFNGVVDQVGHFWSGETKKLVKQVRDLQNLELTIRYTNRASGERITYSVDIPTDFGYSEEARLEYLLHQAGETEAEMLRVRNPRAAGEMRERLRQIVLNILAHPASDEPAVVAVVSRLKASIERLERLERNYDEQDATMHRKRSMQTSHNMRERAKGYSSFEEDGDMVREHAKEFAGSVRDFDLVFAPEALALVPLDTWIRWEAVPIEIRGGTIVVAMEDSRRGFLITEIEKATNLRVKPVFARGSAEGIVAFLRKQELNLFS